MPLIQQSLRALDAADAKIEALQRRTRELRSALAEDAALKDARASEERAAAASAAAAATLQANENALSARITAITSLEKRLYDGSLSSPKEVESAENELRRWRQEQQALEERLMEDIERDDRDGAALAEARQEVQTALETRDDTLRRLKAEGRAALDSLQKVEKDRALLAQSLPSAVLSRYARIRSSLKPATANLHENVCAGCGVTIPTALQQRVRGGDAVQCFTCTRFLID